MARPSKWIELDIPSKLDAIQGWAMEGSTDEELAEMIGAGMSTFYEWKKKYPEFSEAIKKGRVIANGELLNASHKLAKGHNVIEQVAIKLKKSTYKDGKKVSEEEVVEVVDLIKPIPPNPTMLIFMDKNRMPNLYRDRPIEESRGDETSEDNSFINAIEAGAKEAWSDGDDSKDSEKE